MARLTSWLVGFLAADPAPLGPEEPLAESPASTQVRLDEPVCLGDPPCEVPRQIWVDYDELNLDGWAGGEWVTYDYFEVTRPLSYAQLEAESELYLAVRLIISEVGADRLLANRFGMLEAIGILYSVSNRRNSVIHNPLARSPEPTYLGCGDDSTFASCANATEYLGMDTWRALRPDSRYNEDLLAAAADLSAMAWWLHQNRLVHDFTEGATFYVHRCGGVGYGRTTWHCDGVDEPIADLPNAHPSTGPLVFKAPANWQSWRRNYRIRISRQVDYLPWWEPVPESWGADMADLQRRMERVQPALRGPVVERLQIIYGFELPGHDEAGR